MGLEDAHSFNLVVDTKVCLMTLQLVGKDGSNDFFVIYGGRMQSNIGGSDGTLSISDP